MTMEEALREAQGYEARIRDFYAEAARKAGEAAAQVFYARLGAEEESHLHYLEHKAAEWRAKGRIGPVNLASSLPDPARFEAALAKAAAPLQGRNLGGETEALSRALKAEEETSAFYRKLVEELGGEAAPLFGRFLEIEDGHTRIVRAELDLATRTGHWFDLREFDLED